MVSRIPHTTRPVALPLLALSALALPARAQSSAAPEFDANPPVHLAWNASYGTAPFSRVAAGELIGDGMPDVVVQSGSSFVFYWNPAVYDYSMLLPRTGNDFDIAKGAGPGGKDAVAIVSSGGLDLCFVQSTTPLTFGYSSVSTVDWPYARIVRSANLDAAGGADFAGVASDRRTVLMRMGGASSNTSFQVTRDILDLAPIQWDADPPLELSILLTDGVAIYEQDGTIVNSWVSGPDTTNDAMCVVCGNTPRGRVAWIYSTSATTQVLKVMRAGGGVEGPFALPTNLGAYAITAADEEGDGDQDLMIMHHSNYQLAHVLNQSGTGAWFYQPDWDPDEYVDDDAVLAFGSIGETVRPLFAELSGDSRADLFVPMATQTETDPPTEPTCVYLKGRYGLPATAGLLLHGSYLSTFVDLPVPQVDHRLLLLHLNLSTVMDSTLNGLLVTVWRQERAYGDMEPVMVSESLHPVPLGVPDLGNAGLPIQLYDPSDCLIGGQFNESRIYWFVIQPVWITSMTALTFTNPKPVQVAALGVTYVNDCYLLSNAVPSGYFEFSFPTTGGLPGPYGGYSPAAPCQNDILLIPPGCDWEPGDGSTPATVVIGRKRMNPFPPVGVTPAQRIAGSDVIPF